MITTRRKKGTKMRESKKRSAYRKKREFVSPFSETSVHNVKWWSKGGIFQRWCRNRSNKYEIKTNIIFPSKQLLYFLKIISHFSLLHRFRYALTHPNRVYLLKMFYFHRYFFPPDVRGVNISVPLEVFEYNFWLQISVLVCIQQACECMYDFSYIGDFRHKMLTIVNIW